MFAVTSSATLVGAKPRRVHVEAHVHDGKERFSLVGLPDTAIREAKDRVRAAMTS
jgi:magnesium chelatase family protein